MQARQDGVGGRKQASPKWILSLTPFSLSWSILDDIDIFYFRLFKGVKTWNKYLQFLP